MIISEKCNCCMHNEVCNFKDEYLKAIEVIKNACYSVDNKVGYAKDSRVSVSIRCPFILTQSKIAARREADENA